MSNGDDALADASEAPKKIETIAGCKIIDKDDLDELMDVIVGLEDNKARINYLNIQKQPYLFNSEMLMKFVNVTESVKTRVSFIEAIAPRLTDPNAKSSEFIDMFRYANDKTSVEEALKARSETLKSEKMSGKSKGSALGGGGRGGEHAADGPR